MSGLRGSGAMKNSPELESQDSPSSRNFTLVPFTVED